MKYKIIWIVFVFGIVITAASLFTYRYYLSIKPDSNFQGIAGTIQRSISQALALADSKSKSTLHYLQNTAQVRFSDLVLDNNSPYFIYNNKSLVYWSDNTFVPKYESLTGKYKFRLIQFKSGKYIVQRNELTKGTDFYEVYYCIPLSKKYSIENKYVLSENNGDLFQSNSVAIHTESAPNSFKIVDKDNNYLFSITVNESDYHKNFQTLISIFLLAIVALGCFSFCLVALLKVLLKQKKLAYALGLIFFFLFGLRALFLYLNFPYFLFEWNLFNPRYFASSIISPSLGDLFLNTISLTIFLFFLFKVYPYASIFRSLKIKDKYYWVVCIVVVIIHFLAFQILYNTLRIINQHSKWTIDINQSLDFNQFRLVSLIIFILTVANIFFCSHVLCRTFMYFNKNWFTGTLPYAIIIAALFWISKLYFYNISLFIVLLGCAYFLFVILFKFPKQVQYIRYATYIYLLTTAGVCAIVGAYSFYTFHLEKTSIEKNKFASQILIESDVLGEYLLSEAQQNIEADEFIKTRFVTVFSGKEFIEQKIKKVFLPNYFEKYDVQISLYDAFGNAYNAADEFPNYSDAANVLAKSQNVTDYRNVYYIDDLNKSGLRKYVVFNKILKNRNIIGFILIQLTNKKIIPNSVYPELLVDRKFEQTAQGRNYSYAIYAGKTLVSSYGEVNYENDLHPTLLSNSKIYDDGIYSDHFHHLAIRGVHDRVIVVSSEKYTAINIFSNFTFLFLVYLIIILLILLIPAVYFAAKKVHSSFTNKIQIYLNIAFFLPLVIVCITTLSVISNSYKNNLNFSFIQKAAGISKNISNYFGENLNSISLETAVRQMAQYTECDINFYGIDGQLILSSQPMIFSQGLLSGFINAKAYAEIAEKKGHTVLLSESVGLLNYNCVYVAVKSFDTGKLIGIVSVPFFESKQAIEIQVIGVLTTIINIFVSVFLLFVVLSYFASRILTVPLTIITNKIKRTTLGGKNEPLHWEVKDEIGLLVGEYNKMLIHLDESKIALSKSEKESAWREMAKQVAHEIKNPLTPMKLTLQHLQRTLKDHNTSINEKVESVINTMLTQINHLSEIATSFSLFAKMPLPKDEVVDIAMVVASVVALYNNAEATVAAEMQNGNIFVKGDDQSYIGIFSNLMINGIQSVPSSRHPSIKITLQSKANSVLIAVSDNGLGIPEQYKTKIFVPNFSTKYAGSGIGLALTKRNVEHLGGKVWYVSVENEGATFFIELPLLSQ